MKASKPPPAKKAKGHNDGTTRTSVFNKSTGNWKHEYSEVDDGEDGAGQGLLRSAAWAAVRSEEELPPLPRPGKRPRRSARSMPRSALFLR